MQILKIVMMSMFQFSSSMDNGTNLCNIKWCLSRMKVNFVEEPETMFDDLREIGPTFLLLGPRVWEQIAADIRSKIMDSSFIKRKLFDFFTNKKIQ